jgi:hypothetical protein
MVKSTCDVQEASVKLPETWQVILGCRRNDLLGPFGFLVCGSCQCTEGRKEEEAAGEADHIARCQDVDLDHARESKALCGMNASAGLKSWASMAS